MDNRKRRMSLHQSRDQLGGLSHDGSSDDLLHDVADPHDQAPGDKASDKPGNIGRRRSLMSQASVKRLFKWKTR